MKCCKPLQSAEKPTYLNHRIGIFAIVNNLLFVLLLLSIIYCLSIVLVALRVRFLFLRVRSFMYLHFGIMFFVFGF